MPGVQGHCLPKLRNGRQQLETFLRAHAVWLLRICIFASACAIFWSSGFFGEEARAQLWAVSGVWGNKTLIPVWPIACWVLFVALCLFVYYAEKLLGCHAPHGDT